VSPRWRFWFRLAWACGEPHPDALLARLTAAQVLEVEAFAEGEPLPERRADLRAAMVGLVTARGLGNSSVELAHLLPDYDRDPAADDEDQPPEVLDRILRRVGQTAAAAAALGSVAHPPAD
jgi:hypothetical protein